MPFPASAEERYDYLEQPPAKMKTREMEDQMRKSVRDKARRYLQQVLDEYPTTPAAKARSLPTTLDRAAK
jgi:hypothetical protein